jgi:hypothetical protein
VKLNLLLVLIFVLSCQTNPFVSSSIYREIANTKNLSYSKKVISKKISFGSISKILYFPQSVGIHSISFDKDALDCSGKNIVKYQSEKKTKYFVSDDSHLECKSFSKVEHIVDYEFKLLDNNELSNFDHLSIVKNRLKASDFDTFMRESRLSLSLTKRMTLKEFKKIKFEKGDYISIEFPLQDVKHKCHEKNCSEDVPIHGVSSYFNRDKTLNLKQLKFPHLTPFVVFCGGRFSASNIHLNSKESLSYTGYVDENGFSCDTNTYLFSEEDPRVIMDVIHLSKNPQATAELSLVEKYFQTLEFINLALDNSEISFMGGTVDGYLELHFKKERKYYNLVSIQKVTPSRNVIIGKRKTLMFNMRAPASSALDSFVLSLCPQGFRSLLKDSDRDLLDFKGKTSCLIKK